jgi:hypothetical protein
VVSEALSPSELSSPTGMPAGRSCFETYRATAIVAKIAVLASTTISGMVRVCPL